MINGQQVPAGQAVRPQRHARRLLRRCRSAAVRGGAQAVNIPPVVVVNGQVGRGGQPVDLSSVLGPRAPAQVRSSLEQLGLGGQLAGMFGLVDHSVGSTAPSFAQPGPAQAMPYTSTPGEVSGCGNKALMWLAAVLVIGLIGVVAYLMLAG